MKYFGVVSHDYVWAPPDSQDQRYKVLSFLFKENLDSESNLCTT